MMSFSLCLAALMISSALGQSENSSFSPLSSDLSALPPVTHIDLGPPSCPDGKYIGSSTKAKWTVEGASFDSSNNATISILSNPPDFVIPSVGSDGSLNFRYNESVAFSEPVPDEAGVIIQVPYDSLTKITVSVGESATVKGLTSLKELECFSASSCVAILQDLKDPILLDAEKGSVLTMVASNTTKITVEISGGSTINVVGNVAGGTVTTASELVVQGSVVGVEADMASEVTAANCDGVTTDWSLGSCTVNDDIQVDVSTADVMTLDIPSVCVYDSGAFERVSGGIFATVLISVVSVFALIAAEV